MQLKSFLSPAEAGTHRLSYAEWGENTGDGVPTLCMHGLARNGRDFDCLAEALQPHRRVLCPDIAGRGKSDWLENPASYDYPLYRADMNALIAHTGVAQVDWVGTSLGGIVGMMLAAQAHSPIRRLIINDMGPIVPASVVQRIGTYVGNLPSFADEKEHEAYLRTIYAPFGTLSDANWQHMTEYDARRLPDGRITRHYDPRISEVFASTTLKLDLWADYKRISCPILILRGANSDLLTSEMAEEMTRRNVNARLITIPDTGHAPALMNAEQIALASHFLNTGELVEAAYPKDKKICPQTPFPA